MKKQDTREATDNAARSLHRRRVILADGRYLIFYTFGDDEREGEADRERRKPRPPL